MKLLYTLIILLLLNFSFCNIEAITNDGIRVILNKDGSWTNNDSSISEIVYDKNSISNIKIGDTGAIFNIENIDLNVSGKYTYYRSGPNEGAKYIAFLIQVDNSKGRDDLRYRNWWIQLKSLDGIEYNPQTRMAYNKPPIINDYGTLFVIEKGDLLKGWITYEVPITLEIDNVKIRFSESRQDLKVSYNIENSVPIQSEWIYLSNLKQ
jgi:hypothetical protein